MTCKCFENGIVQIKHDNKSFKYPMNNFHNITHYEELFVLHFLK